MGADEAGAKSVGADMEAERAEGEEAERRLEELLHKKERVEAIAGSYM